ncbi:hypothetical protein PYW08_013672 [Mythimna loreyi]|uniref:Uncharacterized protein n=1 Tax=Mythimna loreyi TaxID=667449 RepID=A0ACC2R5U3_9NEOP|nr:hypothetical protein PYW08_013672 [Mythimna loreyi]
MGKCGGCGQFLARAECIRCTKCPGSYHPTCIGVTSTKVAPNWLCPDCKTKIPRKDNSATPVKGPSDGITVSGQPDTTRSSPGTQLAVANQGAVVEQATVEAAIKQPTQPLSQIRTDSGELNVAYEIRCFREELSAMRVELRLFRDEMASLKADVGMCGERMSAIEGKVSHLEKRFEETGSSSSYDHLEETISELKLQLNDRDQDLLLNDVMIAGIPEVKDESPLHTLKLVSVRLGVNIDDRDIVNVERIGAVRRNFTVAGSEDTAEPPRPRALAVRLARRAVRDQLLRAARVRRGLTTADLELRGPPRRFYLNERLTPINSKLFYNARQAGQKHNFKYVWTKDGRIFVKKEDGVPPQRIRSELDLVRIFGNGSV